MRYGVVRGCGFEHAHKRSRLRGRQIFGSDVEIGFAGRLNTIRRGTEVYRVGIHREDGILVVTQLQLRGDNPFFGFHDEHTYAGNFTKQARRIFGAHPKKVFGQLLGDGRCTAAVAFGNGILGGSEHSDGVYPPMAVKTLVFGVDKRIPKHGVNVAVGYRRAVFVEIFADEFSVGTVYFRGLRSYGVVDGGPSRRLAKEPKEVDVYHTQIDKEGNKRRCNDHTRFEIPFAAFV